MTKKLSSGVTTPRQPIQVLSQHNLPNHPSLVRKEEEGGVILINHSSNDGGNKDSYKETSSNSKDYHGNIGNIHNNSTTATAAEEWTEKDREQVQTHSKLEGLLGSVIKSYTIVELRYGAQRYNFAYCKYCEEKGRVIRNVSLEEADSETMV